jgi:Ca-activated chloride channel family protein
VIALEWPAVLLLLPLPLLVRGVLSAASAAHLPALRIPDLESVAQPHAGADPRTAQAALRVAALAWVLLVVAAARPQWSGEPRPVAVPGRDLMLAVDVSGSMDANDFRLDGRIVDRLAATKAVAGGFVARREGDRVGLILFGRSAYVQAPLTFDRATVAALLGEAATGLAGKETAIGDAIGLALKRLQDTPAAARVLILMTDGVSNAGAVEPLQAADLAARAGVRIHTIGIGSGGARRSLSGIPRAGATLRLDEETLRAVALRTGGQYFRADDTQDLERIYALLDELEPLADEREPFRPTVSLYVIPLGIALALAFALLLRRTGGVRAA